MRGDGPDINRADEIRHDVDSPVVRTSLKADLNGYRTAKQWHSESDLIDVEGQLFPEHSVLAVSERDPPGRLSTQPIAVLLVNAHNNRVISSRSRHRLARRDRRYPVESSSDNRSCRKDAGIHLELNGTRGGPAVLI